MKLFKKLGIISLALTTLVGVASCDIESLNKNGAQINLDVDLNEKIELKVLYPNSGMSNTEFKKSRTTQYFEEITGYKVSYEQALSDMGNLVGNIMMSKLDYNMLKLESGTYMAMVSEGNFVDLKPALEKFGQNILNTIPQEAWDSVTQDGKIYAIPEIGFGQMIGSGLIWNMRQLNEVGITKTPETISEVHEALTKLQDKFGTEANNHQYHAFAMQAAQAYIEPLACAFDLNKDFYVNANNEVAHVMYSDNYLPYMKWLNELKRYNCISDEWQGYDCTKMIENFAKGNLGCAFLPYWYINSLVTSLAANKEFANEDEARESIAWSLHIKGDGTHGSAVQEKPKTLYYQSIGYYITIPAHMAEYGAYVIDWIDKRITDEAFEGYRLGEEGVHYEIVDSSDPDGIMVKIAGNDTYIKLKTKYKTQILPTSMYQTGVNPEVAKELWKISEISYNCWEILVDTDYDNIVGNALGMAPYIKGWSEIDIEARSWVLTYEQQIINANSDEVFDEKFNFMTTTWLQQKWTKEVNDNVQAWHKSK